MAATPASARAADPAPPVWSPPGATAPDTLGGAPPPVPPRPALDRPLPAVAPARADTGMAEAKPFLVMLRSAVVPGWGQVYNRQPLKAALVVAGEGYLAYKIFRELKLQNDAVDRLNAATTDAEELAATNDELTHRYRKIDWIWWTAAAHLLQMADAYVDAHFRNFDAEFGTDEAREGAAGAPRLSLAFRVRF